MTAAQRFEAKVTPEPTSGCHLWTGSVDRYGYGRFGLSGRNEPAHRAALMLAGVRIPKGMHVDHMCRVRACVNPLHLRVVTPRENILAGVGMGAWFARSDRCPFGHPYDRVRRGGVRSCSTCERRRRRMKYERLKADPRAYAKELAATYRRRRARKGILA